MLPHFEHLTSIVAIFITILFYFIIPQNTSLVHNRFIMMKMKVMNLTVKLGLKQEADDG